MIEQAADINAYAVRRVNPFLGIEQESNTTFSADYFPSFLIQTDWTESIHSEKVNDYIKWIASSLLTLEQISDTRRCFLEHALTIQAVSIVHHWRHYPLLIDETKLKSARVQSRLQNGTNLT